MAFSIVLSISFNIEGLWLWDNSFFANQVVYDPRWRKLFPKGFHIIHMPRCSSSYSSNISFAFIYLIGIEQKIDFDLVFGSLRITRPFVINFTCLNLINTQAIDISKEGTKQKLNIAFMNTHMNGLCACITCRCLYIHMKELHAKQWD